MIVAGSTGVACLVPLLERRHGYRMPRVPRSKCFHGDMRSVKELPTKPDESNVGDRNIQLTAFENYDRRLLGEILMAPYILRKTCASCRYLDVVKCCWS